MFFFLCCAQNLNTLSCTLAQILRGQTNLFVFSESVSPFKQCVLPPQREMSLLFQFFLNLRKGIAMIRILKQLRTAFFLLNFPLRTYFLLRSFHLRFLVHLCFSFFQRVPCENGVSVYARLTGCVHVPVPQREVAHETYPLFFFHLPQCSGLSWKEKLWVAVSGK